MRNGFRNTLAAVVVTVIVGVAWMILQPPPDPVYDGKRLSVWVQGFDLSNYGPPKQLAWREAEEAVRRIGTNAIPRLLSMLQAKDSNLRLKFIRLAQRQQFIRVVYVPAYRKNIQASYAFGAVGSSASNAIPELIRIYRLNNSSVDSQELIVATLGGIGPAAKNAIPLLIEVAFTNTNTSVSANSLWALGEIHSEPEIVVPALMKFLHDPRSEFRRVTAFALAKFGTEASPAIPSMLELLKDQDLAVRFSVTNALEAIDPEAAAKAGVK